MKTENKLVGVGLLTAISASLCCITPVLALLAGTSGLASTFSWIEPFRPYFISFTFLVLGFAWYQKLKPQKQIDCNCEINLKPNFMQTKTFLGIITTFAIIILAFPAYSGIFFPKTDKPTIVVDKSNAEMVEFKISGMSCTGCEHLVMTEINKQKGIMKAKVSYEKGNAVVKFYTSKTTLEDIEKAINSTGCKIANKTKI